MKTTKTNIKGASSRGIYFNTGNGFPLQVIDIGHKEYAGVVSADSAFWALVKKDALGRIFSNASFLSKFRRKEDAFNKEINDLRFNLKPSAVYFNATDRCNLNCSYCYIPERLRKSGSTMSYKTLSNALKKLEAFFRSTLSKGQRPQIVFHGAEPLMAREAIFKAIDNFGDYFRFGIQTNGTLLDESAVEFLTSRGISIGLSLDGPTPKIADRMRRTWDGRGVSQTVVDIIKRLKGYENYSVICTVTKENMCSLNETVDLLHKLEVPTCMLNQVRCTLPGGKEAKPLDHEMSKYYLAALDRTYELYRKTGRKLVVANFANIVLSILAPSSRKLMCDISPCGGGSAFSPCLPTETSSRAASSSA